MKYRVIYAPSFIQDARESVRYWQSQQVAAATIEEWFNKLFGLVDSLEHWPRRYPVDELPGATPRPDALAPGAVCPDGERHA